MHTKLNRQPVGMCFQCQPGLHKHATRTILASAGRPSRQVHEAQDIPEDESLRVEPGCSSFSLPSRSDSFDKHYGQQGEVLAPAQVGMSSITRKNNLGVDLGLCNLACRAVLGSRVVESAPTASLSYYHPLSVACLLTIIFFIVSVIPHDRHRQDDSDCDHRCECLLFFPSRRKVAICCGCENSFRRQV